MRIPIFIFVLVVFAASCTTREVEPTRASRHTIDTLYHQKIIMMQPEMDSIFRKEYAKAYKANVDSLMAVRQAEMNILVE